MEAASHGRFLAVGGLWSFCRCKGLYVILGKAKEEREKCANLLSRAEQHSFVILVCLEEKGSSCWLGEGKSLRSGGGREKILRRVSAWKTTNLFLTNFCCLRAGPVSQAFRLSPSLICKIQHEKSLSWVRVCAAVCPGLSLGGSGGLRWEAVIHHLPDSSDSSRD